MSAETNLWTALRVLTHNPHGVILASGNGKLLVLRDDQELDVIDDPRAGFDASTYQSQALVRQGEFLTLQRATNRQKFVGLTVGSNVVQVSYTQPGEPLPPDCFLELLDYIKTACVEVGVNLKVEEV